MVTAYHTVQGIDVPTLMYGTAWKEDDTARLSALAFEQGFRGVDTANQRKHYFEAAVGEALRGRSGVFVQTKFTHQGGQDHRLPYDATASLSAQVRQSMDSSLQHLGRVDSYVLHGPSTRSGFGAADREVWATMEALHDAGKTRLLGVSNVSAEQLVTLVGLARVKPAIVQNRCYAQMGWDRGVRAVCDAHGILYQGFSLLTANPQIVRHQTVQAIAARLKRTPEQIVFRFVLQLGMIALSGTTSVQHMKEDLEVFTFELDAAEMARLQELA